ncbi:DUF6279 family lipoprotein [Pseudidiomarina sp.]|uniref:DUF6279 family lipoprotein n=1 Tax=Pseudidiomarina sp. TaxID=2081707 RepID=UPI003A9852E6
MTTLQRFIIIVLTLSALLTGCSTQFSYRFADTYLEWQLGKYVDISGQLETDVDAAIDELHMWHARSELPRYRDLLDQLLYDLDHGSIDAQQLFDYTDEMYGLWQDIRLRVTPYAQEFLPRLSTQQRTQLITNLRERLDEEREEAQKMTAEERFERSFDRALERADDWLGRVHQEQRRMIRRWLQERDDSEALWLEYQEMWLARFAEVLAEPEAANFAEKIDALFTHPEQFRSVELQAQNQANRELAVAVLIVILQNLSPQQEQHLKNKLREYRATLTDLINVYAIPTE